MDLCDLSQVVNFGVDFVLGPSLIHYDSLRVFPCSECKIQTVTKCAHSLSQKPKVKTCE